MGVQPSQDFFQNFEVDMDQILQNSPKLAQITKILKKILKPTLVDNMPALFRKFRRGSRKSRFIQF